MTSETEERQILNLHLVIVPISRGALRIGMLMASVANALGKSYVALTISALRLFALLTLFVARCPFIRDRGAFIGVLVANIIAGWAAWLAYQKLYVSSKERITPPLRFTVKLPSKKAVLISIPTNIAYSIDLRPRLSLKPFNALLFCVRRLACLSRGARLLSPVDG